MDGEALEDLVARFLELRAEDPTLTPAAFAARHPEAAEELESAILRALDCDLVDEDDDVVVTVELPGVGADEISVRLDGRLLEILTSGERRFAKRVPLPAAVLAGQYEQSYRCGVLKLRIRKRT